MAKLVVVDSDSIFALYNPNDPSKLFDPAGSKKNTLIDCSVVAVAKKIKADGVFAYDEFYTKQGLKLAEDLL